MGLNFTGEMVEGVIGYISDIFSDLLPIIIVVIAIGLGCFIFMAITSAIKNK
jgi:F0F1-type ATP synthase assembly protein I